LRMNITAQNLFTITDYKGMDPEVGLANTGADIGAYPLSKVYMAGFNLKF
jgi:TonB-dependent starch-binding outer membrane protein SusC